MGRNRLATSDLKTGIVRKLRADFDAANVQGITQTPPIIQDRILDSLPYPIIYVDISSVEEVAVTKETSAYEYIATINVLAKTTQKEDGKLLRDEISAEVVRLLDCEPADYIDLTVQGFNIYIQTVEAPDPIEPVNAYGSTFWNTEIDVRFRISFVGTPAQRDPVQPSTYTFAGFAFAPSAGRIEVGDAGTITGATTYPSNNEGWNFVSASYAQRAGGDGSLAGNIYTVESGDSTLGLIATLNYEFGADTSITTTVTNTDNFNRIRSVRYGAIAQSSISADDIANFSLFQGTNKVFDFGNTNPVGDDLFFSGSAGDRFYIVYDSAHTITEIRDEFGFNNIGAFTETTIGNYKILLQTNPLVFDTTSPIQYLIR